MIASTWPPWTYGISWLWTNPASYNFWSCAWGEHLFDALALLALYLLLRPVFRRVEKHFECHVDDCSKPGHVVHGTGYRACHDHHPAVAHKPGEAITAAHIAEAHARVRTSTHQGGNA